MSATTRAYYDRYWSPGGYSPEGRLEPRVQQLLEDVTSPPDACLDYGCGNGCASGLWLRENAARYVGVDVSETAVKAARALGLDAILLSEGADLPFADGLFDLVVCVEVLEHLFDPLAAASEMVRVLKPGGTLLATVPNVAYWRQRADLALLGRWNPYGDDLSVAEPWRDPHIRFFNARALRRMLQRAGFRDVEVSGHGGAILDELPGLRRFRRSGSGERASRAYRVLEGGYAPGLLGARLHALAHTYRPLATRR